jgi:hypothetical protein
MSQTNTGTRPANHSRAQRMTDVMMRTMLRSPLHRLVSGKMLIITVTGRKTGRVYSNPVGYVESDGTLLIGTLARWRHNLRPGQPVQIIWRGRQTAADWQVISGGDEILEPYQVIIAHNPTHARAAGISLNDDGTINRDELQQALSKGAAVVRLHPRKRT